MRILIVDDNRDNVELVSDIVRSLSYEVLQAFDGIQALAAAQSQRPDLILLDINMPGLSGFDVVSSLKADTRTAQIPVIMLTALSDIDHHVEGLGLGADDYLTKPFRPRELIARIETRLRAKSQTDNLLETQEIIQQMFERFVSPSVVQKLLEDPASVRLGGKMQEVTVLFADIENFTLVSEKVSPDVLLVVLNRYHELMVETIQSHGGTIDKFMGDAVMALYNTPLELENHPQCAVASAYYIREALHIFHRQFDPEFRLQINFGIHTGTAIVGNVGSPKIMDFTAVGDTVNVAARLQENSHGGRILISEAVKERLDNTFSLNPVGALQFHGRSSSVMVHEVMPAED